MNIYKTRNGDYLNLDGIVYAAPHKDDHGEWLVLRFAGSGVSYSMTGEDRRWVEGWLAPLLVNSPPARTAAAVRRDQLLAYVDGLGADARRLFNLADGMELAEPDTLSEDYQVLAEVLGVFQRRAAAREAARDA